MNKKTLIQTLERIIEGIKSHGKNSGLKSCHIKIDKKGNATVDLY